MTQRRRELALGLSAILVVSVAGGAQQRNEKRPPRESISPAQQGEAARISDAAMRALRSGDYASAVQGLEKLIQMAPGVAEFHANLGMAYYSAGRPRDAIAPCRNALKLKPGLTSARYFLGLSLAEGAQCAEALPYLEGDYNRVADPQLKRLMGTDAARCAMALDRPDKAVDFLRWLDRDFPNDPEVLYWSTQAYSDLSTRASQQLLHTAPGSYQAHRLNAEVLEMRGKVEEAIAECRRVLSLNPRLPGIHHQIGRLLLSAGPDPAKLDAARREFEEELRLDPTDPASEYALGEMARQARRWSEAIQHFERAARLAPDFTSALIGLGKSLVSAGRAREALAPLEAAVKLAPDNPVAHYQLSFAYRRVGREEEAKKELAFYREAHGRQLRTMQTIRAGILGSITQPQTAEPPE
jgi:tetratricopeptide (TPR) repeat protein